jgi:hypothetical protein
MYSTVKKGFEQGMEAQKTLSRVQKLHQPVMKNQMDDGL